MVCLLVSVTRVPDSTTNFNNSVLLVNPHKLVPFFLTHIDFSDSDSPDSPPQKT